MGEQATPCRVVLIGMMGSGKTTIGRLLSALTGWPYFDNDALLAMLRGETARGLLAHEGVSELREGEAEALRAGLRQPPSCIVGAPAGTILEPDIRAELAREALVVWLTAGAKTLAERAKDAPHRPWLSGDAEAWMSATLAQRSPLYESVANLKVSTDEKTPQEVAAQIADWLKGRCQ